MSDLAEREVDATQDRTSVFARTVIETMGASTAMRNKPDQQAGFRVLKTAQFPSVLIELAYVTNKQDAANLQSDAWRDKVTQLDPHRHRQLLLQPGRPAAHVRRRRRRLKQKRPVPQGPASFLVAKLGRTPVSAKPPSSPTRRTHLFLAPEQNSEPFQFEPKRMSDA